MTLIEGAYDQSDPGNWILIQNPGVQAEAATVNFPASTKLIAPIKRGSSPSVEAITRADMRPRQILFSLTALVNSSAMSGQAREISPPTITASGLRPLSRFEIPRPR